MIDSVESSLKCPLPLRTYQRVMMAHGGGGRMMRELIEGMIIPLFDNSILNEKDDSAVIEINGAKLAFTTDSYVVNPLFFPGGDIGELAVNGTVNDLSMSGAAPLFLSAGFIIEEGFEFEILRKIVLSMRRAADTAGVQLVTGDTKVVERSRGDGIYINTAGIGVIKHSLKITPGSVQPGDAIIINGDIGRHGIAVMSAREGLEFETTIESDCAPLNKIVKKLIDSGIEIHCMRDLTRGGLGSSLVEIAETAGFRLEIEEHSILIDEQVSAACEILGLDPLYIANEGRFIAFIPLNDAEKAVNIMRNDDSGRSAVIIGRVSGEKTKIVSQKCISGAHRIIDMPSGEQLPRIC
ncbi:hydrogenase expression/formation protein HypE [bacterium]|nr:hydrogenase expression/formation protein HypE [FCB group bacterium]MBL7191270.1 hydrogenase expression/formation protein HypE [bacterium]